MAREVKERRIGPHLYRVRQLGAKANTAALEEVLRVFGPALGGAAEYYVRGENALEAYALAAGGGLSTLCATLPSGALWRLFELYTEGSENQTTVVIDDPDAPGGRREPVLRDVADDLWSGDRYADFFAWLAFAMEVNHSSFFADRSRVTGWLKNARAKVDTFRAAESASESPATSTG